MLVVITAMYCDTMQCINTLTQQVNYCQQNARSIRSTGIPEASVCGLSWLPLPGDTHKQYSQHKHMIQNDGCLATAVRDACYGTTAGAVSVVRTYDTYVAELSRIHISVLE